MHAGAPTASTRTYRRREDDRGAALVEFALILPLLVMILLGMVTGGLAYNQKLQVTHAVREGARYGATISADQAWTSGTWATNVRELVVERSGGDLVAAGVCVALVENTSATTTVVVTAPGRPASQFTTNGTSPCYTETYPQFSTGDSGRRVQVSASRPAQIQLGIIPDIKLTISSKATARAEVSE